MQPRLVLRAFALVLAASCLAPGLTACTSTAPDPTLIAFLLGSDGSPRWAAADEPAFRAQVAATCPDCELVTRNAAGDPALQQRQFDEVVKQGADVVVLNAVTSEVGEEMVARADGVAVVAYDRFVAGADYYVSFDADAVGSQVARAVVRRVGRRASVLLLNGAQTDANGVAIKAAVHEVFDQAEVRVLAEKDPTGWSADEARTWIAEQLRKHPAATLDAIVAANDAQAEGVAEALRAAGVKPPDWPVLTGQDADLAALRRIIAGQQTLTVYKSFPREATRAADLAITLVTGGTVKGAESLEGVPSFVFRPQVVTLENLTTVVVGDGVISTEQLCAGGLLRRCIALGLR